LPELDDEAGSRQALVLRPDPIELGGDGARDGVAKLGCVREDGGVALLTLERVDIGGELERDVRRERELLPGGAPVIDLVVARAHVRVGRAGGREEDGESKRTAQTSPGEEHPQPPARSVPTL
jgi:hypothetical protein